MKVSTQYNPTLFTAQNGKTYAVGGEWVEVPIGTTLADLEWSPPDQPEPEARPTEFRTRILSSDGRRFYEVIIRSDGVRWCTCTGFAYRHNCRHVREVSDARAANQA